MRVLSISVGMCFRTLLSESASIKKSLHSSFRVPRKVMSYAAKILIPDLGVRGTVEFGGSNPIVLYLEPIPPVRMCLMFLAMKATSEIPRPPWFTSTSSTFGEEPALFRKAMFMEPSQGFRSRGE